MTDANGPAGSHPSPFPEIARVRFTLRALGPIRLPEYPGSAWRGLLGHGLRRTACVTRAPDCRGCLLIHGCVYAQLFETPPPPGVALQGFSAVPHPFVLDLDPHSPRQYRGGEALSLGITLFGGAIAQIPYLIHALGVAGQRGIGAGQGTFALETLEREETPGCGRWDTVYRTGRSEYQTRQATPLEVPAAPEAVRLRLITPLRIKRGGHFVGAREFEPSELLRHLYTRLQRLALLYGGHPESFAWGRGPDLTGEIRVVDPDLRWHDWTRYSSRQGTLMQMGGLLGELGLLGPALPRVWAGLWAGQWTHLGKGTAFGLGAYRLEPTA